MARAIKKKEIENMDYYRILGNVSNISEEEIAIVEKMARRIEENEALKKLLESINDLTNQKKTKKKL